MKIDHPHSNHIDFLIRNGITPSEDCFLSYMFQSVIGCKFTNMQDKYRLAKQSKNYESTEFDVIS